MFCISILFCPTVQSKQEIDNRKKNRNYAQINPANEILISSSSFFFLKIENVSTNSFQSIRDFRTVRFTILFEKENSRTESTRVGRVFSNESILIFQFS